MAKTKILIVEDNEDLARGLTIRLQRSGYDVGYALDAISAVSQARKLRPDVTLLDLGLPGGDGFLVMKRLKMLESMALKPIVVLTGKPPYPNRDLAFDEGVFSYLQKPVDNDKLLATIELALQQAA